jgi:hypothetical protein
MLKKLLVTAAAAAAMSVPLAGVAWADQPADPGSNGNGLGQGGVPVAAGEALNRNYPGAFPDKVPPGSIFSDAAKLSGNLPEGYGAALTQLFNTAGLPDVFPGGTAPAIPPPSGTTIEVGPTVPGSVVKLFTPGCVNGKGPRPTATVNGQTVGANCAS